MHYSRTISQGVARVGFSAEATITYQVEPQGTAKACTTSGYQTCAGLYDSWPGNTISLYAWYQIRRIKWCLRKIGWIKVSIIFNANKT